MESSNVGMILTEGIYDRSPGLGSEIIWEEASPLVPVGCLFDGLPKII